MKEDVLAQKDTDGRLQRRDGGQIGAALLHERQKDRKIARLKEARVKD